MEAEVSLTFSALTVQHRLVEAPVDAQTVLLLLHASFALTAVQWRGQQGRHGVLTVVPGPGPQLHTAVSGHALPQGPQTRTAGVVAGAGVSRTQAVSAGHGLSQRRNS